MERIKVILYWFRRDLRLQENHGLQEATRQGLPVIPLFIFDTNILEKLTPGSKDKRISFIHDALSLMEKEIKEQGSLFLTANGDPEDVFRILTDHSITGMDISAVYCNEDYEPEALSRDSSIADLLKNKGIDFAKYKDQVIFAKDEVHKKDGSPYTVFTPYAKKWIEKLESSPETYLPFNKIENLDKTLLNNITIIESLKLLTKRDFPGGKKLKFYTGIPSPEETGFKTCNHNLTIPYSLPIKLISNYHFTRNFPAIEGTSIISTHLRFGTVSIHDIVRDIYQNILHSNNLQNKSDTVTSYRTWLNELVWRDFFKMILHHFPNVQDEPFKPKYKFINWRNNQQELQRWCEGNTGYPMVDAGMRELNNTGLMHNRARMVTASFLVKHLLIDWRIGEAYFAEKLLDYDLSSNNGNWQWVAGSGCDAAPYFRIFNPSEQARKYDSQNKYINKWIPEINSSSYPAPICNHKEARIRAIETYKNSLKNI